MSHQEQDVELQFREKLDMSSAFMRQLERTNISATQLDPSVYEGNVRRLMDLLPVFYRAKVWQQSEKYNTVVEDFEYEEAGGQKIGSPSNPVCYVEKNGEIVQVPVKKIEGEVDPEDPNIKEIRTVENDGRIETEYVLHDESKPVRRLMMVDWGDPNIFSPKLVEREITDYEELHKVILQEAENAGLTWSTEKTNKAIKIQPDKTRYKTPYLPKLEKYLKVLARLKELENRNEVIYNELLGFTVHLEGKYGDSTELSDT